MEVFLITNTLNNCELALLWEQLKQTERADQAFDRCLALAPADTEAVDLTGPASGYAIEVATTESVTTVFAFTPKEPNGRAIHMTGFLVSPSRPGEALRTAAARGIPVA